MLIGAAGSVDVTTLLGYTRFLTNTLDNVSAFPDASIVALMNIGYRNTQTYLLSQIMNNWKENTVNGTSTGELDLTAATNRYAFPTGLLTIDRIEVNYAGAENTWVVANPIKLESMETAISNTAGNAPIRFGTANPHYWPRDGYIQLDPIPVTSVTDGLKFWCTTLITDLAIGVTAAGPVFATPFHPLVAIDAAIRWFKQKKRFTEARELEKEKAFMRIEMVEFYSKRQADERSRLSAKKRHLK